MIWGRQAGLAWSPSLTRPSSGYSSPIISLMRVDFPVPLSPMRAMRSPPSIFRVMLSNRCLSPQDLARFRIPSISSPWNSAVENRASIFRALVGLAVVRMRSIRRSMLMARRQVLSMPWKAQRRSWSAARSSCSILACSFWYCFRRS